MTPDERVAELHLTAEVTSRLESLGLSELASRAREYGEDVLRGVPVEAMTGRTLDGAWTHERVLDWACILRIPPYALAYPVLPRGPGPKCRCSAPRPFRATTFPGGSKNMCTKCRFVWLELGEVRAHRRRVRRTDGAPVVVARQRADSGSAR